MEHRAPACNRAIVAIDLACGHKEALYARTMTREPADEFMSVHAGHFHIGEHDIKGSLTTGSHRLNRTGRLGDFVARAFEAQREN